MSSVCFKTLPAKTSRPTAIGSFLKAAWLGSPCTTARQGSCRGGRLSQRLTTSLRHGKRRRDAYPPLDEKLPWRLRQSLRSYGMNLTNLVSTLEGCSAER